MRVHHWTRTQLGRGVVVAVVLAFLGGLLAVAETHATPAAAFPAPQQLDEDHIKALAEGLKLGTLTKAVEGKLDATIFSYDGKEFIRTESTVLTKNGKSVVNSRLAHDTPAYKALMHKHSYSGEATIFGRGYQANYAPLTGEDGKLTGALFVGVPK
jgi:hypothetical protein